MTKKYESTKLEVTRSQIQQNVHIFLGNVLQAYTANAPELARKCREIKRRVIDMKELGINIKTDGMTMRQFKQALVDASENLYASNIIEVDKERK